MTPAEWSFSQDQGAIGCRMVVQAPGDVVYVCQKPSCGLRLREDWDTKALEPNFLRFNTSSQILV